jgi:hypothetical protein
MILLSERAAAPYLSASHTRAPAQARGNFEGNSAIGIA